MVAPQPGRPHHSEGQAPCNTPRGSRHPTATPSPNPRAPHNTYPPAGSRHRVPRHCPAPRNPPIPQPPLLARRGTGPIHRPPHRAPAASALRPTGTPQRRRPPTEPRADRPLRTLLVPSPVPCASVTPAAAVPTAPRPSSGPAPRPRSRRCGGSALQAAAPPRPPLCGTAPPPRAAGTAGAGAAAAGSRPQQPRPPLGGPGRPAALTPPLPPARPARAPRRILGPGPGCDSEAAGPARTTRAPQGERQRAAASLLHAARTPRRPARDGEASPRDALPSPAGGLVGRVPWESG
nr:proline-rich protein 2-like [Taeniopygia guttata]